MSAIGTKRTSACALHMSAFDPKRTSTSVWYMHLATAQDGPRAAFCHWHSPFGFARRCSVGILSIPTDTSVRWVGASVFFIVVCLPVGLVGLALIALYVMNATN